MTMIRSREEILADWDALKAEQHDLALRKRERAKMYRGEKLEADRIYKQLGVVGEEREKLAAVYTTPNVGDVVEAFGSRWRVSLIPILHGVVKVMDKPPRWASMNVGNVWIRTQMLTKTGVISKHSPNHDRAHEMPLTDVRRQITDPAIVSKFMASLVADRLAGRIDEHGKIIIGE